MKRRLLFAALVAAIPVMFASAGENPSTSSTGVDWKKAEDHYIRALHCGNCGVRRSALGFIGEYKLTGAKQQVIEILKSDTQDQNRMAAALALVRLAEKDCIEAVEFAARNDESELVSVFCRSLLTASNAHILASE
ncbi:MAG: HEAT repeat domain-containing protein [Ignavibacteriales bacterium]|nr:HEAT repeat domain-containing protein [Ignavibacteriales bacterium]